MANNCFFSARVKGEKEVVNKLVDWCKEHAYDSIDIEPDEDDENDVYMYGDVAWSILTGWNIEKYTPTSEISVVDSENITEEQKHMIDIANMLREERLQSPSLLDIKGDYQMEVYSEECGMGFTEHYIFKDGEILLDDTREYYESWDEDTDVTTRNGGYSEYIFDFDPNKTIPKYDNYKD